jgi:hypothetical protein
MGKSNLTKLKMKTRKLRMKVEIARRRNRKWQVQLLMLKVLRKMRCILKIS